MVKDFFISPQDEVYDNLKIEDLKNFGSFNEEHLLNDKWVIVSKDKNQQKWNVRHKLDNYQVIDKLKLWVRDHKDHLEDDHHIHIQKEERSVMIKVREIKMLL